jgi:hypothetical protein
MEAQQRGFVARTSMFESSISRTKNAYSAALAASNRASMSFALSLHWSTMITSKCPSVKVLLQKRNQPGCAE